MDPKTTPPQAPLSPQVPLVPRFLALLVLLLLLSTSFLSYRNMQLRKQLTSLQTIPSPTPISDPTVNWKTFNNSGKGLSIKYPNSWNDPTEMVQTTRTDYNFASGNLDITIGFYYDQALQRIRTYEEEVALVEKSAVGKKSVIIGGVAKTVYVNTIGPSITEETALFKADKLNIIWIRMTFPPGSDPSIFDQILSTFRFIDQITPTTTCKPRPRCLDATPRCMIPETADMCPRSPTSTSYTCPPSGWVDCMPGPDSKPECSPEAMSWYKSNCPNFQGGAL